MEAKTFANTEVVEEDQSENSDGFLPRDLDGSMSIESWSNKCRIDDLVQDEQYEDTNPESVEHYEEKHFQEDEAFFAPDVPSHASRGTYGKPNVSFGRELWTSRLGGTSPSCKTLYSIGLREGAAAFVKRDVVEFAHGTKVRLTPTEKLLTYCFLCQCPGHNARKCSPSPYCKLDDRKQTTAGGRVCLQQSSAQMSFRVSGRGEHEPDSVECTDCHTYHSTASVCSGRSSSVSDSEDTNFRRRKTADPYQAMERECDNWFRSSNREYTPNSNLLESEESVAIICGLVNGMQTTMLLDTGSSISAITHSFAQQLHLETWYTDDVLVVTLANTHVERYPERMCVVTLAIGDLELCEELNVLPGQIYNVTLGKNWLKSHMAICDYGLDILRLPGSRPIRMGMTVPPIPLKSALRKDKIRKPRRQLGQSAEVRPSYPSLRTLLFLGGWLPPCLRSEAPRTS